MAGKSSQAVRRIDSENHSVLKPCRPVFDMNDGVAPGALLAKLPIVILEKFVLGCSEIVHDNVAQCAEGFGCRKRSYLPTKLIKRHNQRFVALWWFNKKATPTQQLQVVAARRVSHFEESQNLGRELKERRAHCR